MITKNDFKQPEDFTAHNFSPCNSIGGSAFRDWYMLMRHKGVFIGFHNHKWVVFFSSDPNATWERGCQNSRAHGDPRPRSSTAKIVGFDLLPQEAHTLAKQWFDEAIEIAREKISAHQKAEEEKKKKEQEANKKDYEENIKNPWVTAARGKL